MGRGRRWAGVGIGLATAIKLDPGRLHPVPAGHPALAGGRYRHRHRHRGATLLAAAVFPDQSREFWTSALWDTNRVGVLSYVSNQSLRGFLARLPIDRLASYVWIVCVLATLAVWAWRVRRADDFRRARPHRRPGLPDQPGHLGAPLRLAAARAGPLRRRRACPGGTAGRSTWRGAAYLC